MNLNFSILLALQKIELISFQIMNFQNNYFDKFDYETILIPLHSLKNILFLLGLQEVSERVYQAECHMISARLTNRELTVNDCVHLLSILEDAKTPLINALSLVKDNRYVNLKDFCNLLKGITQHFCQTMQRYLKIHVIGLEADIPLNQAFLLYDSLIEIIKNSIFHGLEKPRDRISHGKFAKGIITIKFNYLNNQIYFSASNDGLPVINKSIDLSSLISKTSLSDLKHTGYGINIFNELLNKHRSTVKNPTFFGGHGLGLAAIQNDQNKRIILRSDSFFTTTRLR